MGHTRLSTWAASMRLGSWPEPCRDTRCQMWCADEWLPRAVQGGRMPQGRRPHVHGSKRCRHSVHHRRALQLVSILRRNREEDSKVQHTVANADVVPLQRECVVVASAAASRDIIRLASWRHARHGNLPQPAVIAASSATSAGLPNPPGLPRAAATAGLQQQHEIVGKRWVAHG